MGIMALGTRRRRAPGRKTRRAEAEPSPEQIDVPCAFYWVAKFSVQLCDRFLDPEPVVALVVRRCCIHPNVLGVNIVA
jgi:hypothetical protein